MVRLGSALAIIGAGDGLIGVLFPARHVRRWESGPPPYRQAMSWFRGRPEATRALAIAELAVAILVAARLPPHE